MENRQILIVEDDRILREGLKKALADGDRHVMAVGDLTGAREQLMLGTTDLVLLDIGLPDGSGLGLLREIRSGALGRDKLPVILLTANDTDADIVGGLKNGADDYVTKPFSLAVLRARVETQLRKTAPEKENGGSVIKTGPFVFDFDVMSFFDGERQIELSRTEQRLLRMFAENQGITLSRERLLEAVWPDGTEFVEENALSVAVKRLRDKLGEKAQIKTVYGVGYRWEAS